MIVQTNRIAVNRSVCAAILLFVYAPIFNYVLFLSAFLFTRKMGGRSQSLPGQTVPQREVEIHVTSALLLLIEVTGEVIGDETVEVICTRKLRLWG